MNGILKILNMVFRIRKAKRDGWTLQWQKDKDEKKNNGPHKTTQKTKD